MAKEIKLPASSREITGTSGVRRLRKTGVLPGAVSNERGEARHIQLNQHDFEMLLHHHTSENLIVDLTVDGGDPVKALLKDVQHDPLSGDVLHVDLVEISMTRKMRVSIPLTLMGEPIGVVQEDGVLEHVTREVEVECLPTDLVEEFEVDVSQLKIGDTLQISDLDLGEKFEVLSPPEVAIASVAMPRVEEEPEEAEEAEEAEGAEPEVIGEKKEGEEEEAEDGAKEKAEE